MFFTPSIYIGMNTNAQLKGDFTIDGVSKSHIAHVLDNQRDAVTYTLSPATLTFKERLTLIFKDQLIIIGVLLLTLLLMFINTIHTVVAWLTARAKEFHVRFLVGAHATTLFAQIICDYWKVLTMSSICGIGGAYIVHLTGLFDTLFTSFHWQAIACAILFCFLFGTIITTPIIAIYTKRFTVKKRGVSL